MLLAIAANAAKLARPLNPDLDGQFPVTGYYWIDVWGAWDTGWFMGIAQGGYPEATITSGKIVGEAAWAFFPLYPMSGAILSNVSGLHTFVSLVLISQTAFVASLFVLYRETEAVYAKVAATWAVILACVIPGTHFFSSAYSEALFLLFVLLSLRNARLEQWIWAGLFGGLAALTRNTGVFLALPIVVYFALRHGSRPADVWQHATVIDFARLLTGLALVAAGLASYMTYLYFLTGDPLAFASVQSAWGRRLNFPITNLIQPLITPGNTHPIVWLSAVAAWASVVGLALLCLKRQWAHAAFVGAVVTLSLSAGLGSYFRFLIVMAPLLMLGGSLLAKAQAPVAGLALGLTTMMSGAAMVAWAIGINLI